LHRVFGEREVAGPQRAGQRGDHLPRLTAEQMIN
jgi:hypothetical protein